MVAQLSSRPECPKTQLAVGHQASANARTHYHEPHILRATALTECKFTKGSHPGIVQEKDRPLGKRCERRRDAEAAPLLG
jgi:hypothetical protein